MLGLLPVLWIPIWVPIKLMMKKKLLYEHWLCLVFSFCVFCFQGAQRAPEARAARVDPPAETQQAVSRNNVQEDQQPTQAGWESTRAHALKKHSRLCVVRLTSAIVCRPQISCGTAACRPITKCFTTVTWRRTRTIHQLKHCKRRVSWSWANVKIYDCCVFIWMNLTWSSLCFPPPSVPVADIKGLLTGKDCPHMKENKGKQNKVSSTPRLFRFCSCSPPVGWLSTSHCVCICTAGGAGPGI